MASISLRQTEARALVDYLLQIITSGFELFPHVQKGLIVPGTLGRLGGLQEFRLPNSLVQKAAKFVIYAQVELRLVEGQHSAFSVEYSASDRLEQYGLPSPPLQLCDFMLDGGRRQQLHLCQAEQADRQERR